MTRNELQLQAANILEKDKRLICTWGTGTGKSGIVMKFLERHPDFRTLILVPEQNNIQNWRDEFSKFGVFDFGVDIACYASFHKYENTKWDFVCFDEAPHVNTDKRLNICYSVKADYILALGAVITDEQIQSLQFAYGLFAKSHFGLDDAIDAGILPTPTIKVLHMQLDDKEAVYKDKKGVYTAKRYYEILNKKIKDAVTAYNLKSSYKNKMNMLRLGGERKRFLGKQKDIAIKRICSTLDEKKKRFLCFCSSIQQAEQLGGEYAFTSKTPSSFKLLDRFNDGEISSLYVVGKLIEGQNLKNIECGIIGQLGGTDRITIQSIGRIMRSKNPIIYVLMFDETKDVGFLKTLTENISKDYIKHYKF